MHASPTSPTNQWCFLTWKKQRATANRARQRLKKSHKYGCRQTDKSTSAAMEQVMIDKSTSAAIDELTCGTCQITIPRKQMGEHRKVCSQTKCTLNLLDATSIIPGTTYQRVAIRQADQMFHCPGCSYAHKDSNTYGRHVRRCDPTVRLHSIFITFFLTAVLQTFQDSNSLVVNDDAQVRLHPSFITFS